MEQAGLARGSGGGGGGDGVDWGHPFWISDSFLADKGLRSHPADPEVGLTSRESREEHLCSRRLEAQRGRNSLERQEISADGLCQ